MNGSVNCDGKFLREYNRCERTADRCVSTLSKAGQAGQTTPATIGRYSNEHVAALSFMYVHELMYASAYTKGLNKDVKSNRNVR